MKKHCSFSLGIVALAIVNVCQTYADGFNDKTAAATEYSLADYLQEVSTSNADIKAAVAQNQALGLSARQIEVAYSPYLNAEISRSDSQAPNSNPELMGERTLDSLLNISLSKRFVTGTTLSLGYKNEWSQTEYPESQYASLMGSSSDPFYIAGTSLTVNQSLIKDFMAAATQAALRKTRASAKAAQCLNQYKIKQIIMQAEMAYIQVAVAQADVNILEETLARNRRILQWNQRRAASNLVDASDTLQTQAAITQVEINLLQAQENLKNAYSQFNLLRGYAGSESVPPLNALAMPAVAIEKNNDRLDVKAAEFTRQSQAEAVAETYQANLPDLTLFGTVGLNGRDSALNPAVSEATSTRYPNTIIGLKLSTSLDISLINDGLRAADSSLQSSDQELMQKKHILENDWDELKRNWSSTQVLLEKSTQLEKLQKAKLEREKERFRNGLTTNYQVLQFESDYSQAQLSKLHLIAKACQIVAQARFYNAGLE